MQKVVIGGLALVLVAGGVLVVVTGAVVYRRRYEPAASVSPSSHRIPSSQPLDTEEAPQTVTPSDNRRTNWLSQYTLIERDGEPFHSKNLKGKVSVANFFFASCPHNCRLQNRVMEDLHREYGGKGVKFLSITCDPKHDTPAALRKYAEGFEAGPNWLFLTGDDMVYIRRVGAEVYRVPVDERSHSEKLILVNRQGEVDGWYSWNDPRAIEQLKERIDAMLKD